MIIEYSYFFTIIFLFLWPISNLVCSFHYLVVLFPTQYIAFGFLIVPVVLLCPIKEYALFLLIWNSQQYCIEGYFWFKNSFIVVLLTLRLLQDLCAITISVSVASLHFSVHLLRLLGLSRRSGRNSFYFELDLYSFMLLMKQKDGMFLLQIL